MLQSKDIGYLKRKENMIRVHAVYKRPTSEQKTYRDFPDLKDWKKIFQANGQEKKAGVAILLSHRIDFKTKVTEIDKEGNYIILKGRIPRTL